MVRKKQVEEQSYWRERWLEYAWWETLGFSEGERPKTRRKNGLKLSFDTGRITLLTPQRYAGQYRTTFRVKPLGKRAWKQVLDRLATTPEALQNLLAGRPGQEIEDLMAELEIELFPSADGDEAFRCDCHEWQCNHRTYLITAVAEQLPQNPFLWLTVMGLERGELLAGISARQEDALPGADGPALDPDRFWSTPADPDQITVRPGEALAPDALLLRLGPLPLTEAAAVVTLVEHREVETEWGERVVQDLVQLSVDQALRRYAKLIGTGAAALAKGGSLPTLAPAKLPGKAVPAKQRLLPELIQAVQEAGRPLSLAELITLAPTAAILESNQAGQKILEVATELPVPLQLVGRFYVADRTRLLEEARFRHTISFIEWHERRLSLDSDWYRALLAAGHGPSVQVTVDEQWFQLSPDQSSPELFAVLAPEVGDELELTPLGPSTLLLRRCERTPVEPASDLRTLATLRPAVQLSQSLSEVEAVELLLAAGCYTADVPPSPVWLLTLVSGEVGPRLSGPDRRVTHPSWRTWHPTLGRKAYGYWSNSRKYENEMERKLYASGTWNRHQLHLALRWLSHWIRVNPGGHDAPASAPSLASLLHYLWIDVQIHAAQNNWATERILELMTAWLTLLSTEQPVVAEHYRPHLAACRLGKLFQQRMLSADKTEGLRWYMRGLQLVGPELLLK